VCQSTLPAKLLRVTPTAVNRAKKILKHGIPDVVEAVEDGSLTLWKALPLAKLRNSEQQAEMDLRGTIGGADRGARLDTRACAARAAASGDAISAHEVASLIL
jgi:hypothetical protein